MKVILASASPRRQQLLQQVGWELEVRVAPFSEVKTIEQLNELRQKEQQILPADFALEKGLDAAEKLVAYNAYGKAAAVQERLAYLAKEAGIPEEIVARGTTVPIVAAYTIVVKNGVILGKPVDKADAIRMLANLSNGWHEVKTGVAILYMGKSIVRVVATAVHFRRLTVEEINAYVQTGEPMDKAGGYGIQGRAAIFCDRIEGSYDNVVGLPLAVLQELVQQVIREGKGT